MLNQTSQEFRELFLKKFTNQLIKNSETAEARAIKQRLKERIKENIEKKEEEKKLMRIVEKKEVIKELEEIPLREKIKKKTSNISFSQKFKNIRNQIPETIRNILPFPTNETFDLGKLNPLIADPTINLIECEAPNTYIAVKRLKNETRIINIKLTENEIEEIIRKFSKASKIPFENGPFKAAFGKLIISAIISDVDGSSFVITKMLPYNQQNIFVS